MRIMCSYLKPPPTQTCILLKINKLASIVGIYSTDCILLWSKLIFDICLKQEGPNNPPANHSREANGIITFFMLLKIMLNGAHMEKNNLKMNIVIGISSIKFSFKKFLFNL
jgi:hypothetical protein